MRPERREDLGHVVRHVSIVRPLDGTLGPARPWTTRQVVTLTACLFILLISPVAPTVLLDLIA